MVHPHPTMRRRDILKGSVMAGAAVAGASASAVAQTAATSADPTRPSVTTLLADPAFNFSALIVLGAAGYGASEVGEVLSAVDRINARGLGYDSYFDEFFALGESLRGRAEAALAANHKVSARAAFLRAAAYYNQGLFFVLGTKDPSRETAVYQVMQACWDKAAALFSPVFERVDIPYEGTTLPGYLLKPPGVAARRPTVILNNGSDGQNIDLYSYGGLAAIERGYNALIFEGPGQGSMLFERKIPFRPDWEKVVTPVFDYLAGRPDVDPKRIALVGLSFAGELCGRAAAYEHRLAALCLDPGCPDATVGWPKEILAIGDAGDRAKVNAIWAEVMKGATPEEKFMLDKRSEIYVAADAYDLLRDIKQYVCVDDMPKITSPTLVLDPEGEQFYPGGSQWAYDLLTCEKKLVKFTVAEGANLHCEPMAPQRRSEVIFDWLDGVMRA
jgi:dienelactone hydrolase